MKLKKGMNVAHVEASQVVPPLEESSGERKVCGNSQFKTLAKERNERISKIFRTARSYSHRVLDGTIAELSLKTVRRVSVPVRSKFERVG